MSASFLEGNSTSAASPQIFPAKPLVLAQDASVRGVLFDLDGTLLDTERLLLASFRYTVKKVLGESIPDKRLMAKVGQPLDTQMWDFTDDVTVHEQLCRTYREHNAQVHDDYIDIFPGTVAMLSQLHQAGYAMGVVTSKRHKVATKGLEFFGLQSFFRFLIGSDDWPTHKPDPGPVKHGCSVLGLHPSECLYVGDSPFDMQSGNGAGCRTVAAVWGMFPSAVVEEQHPTFVCTDMHDLSALIQSL